MPQQALTLANPSHEVFAREYANTGIAYKAALAAGLTATWGRALAERADIQARVAQIIEQRFSKANVTAERVIRELARIAFANVADLFDENGCLLPIHELPDEVAATITSFESEDIWNGRGENRVKVTLRKVKQAPKMEALTVLAKHFKVIGDVDEGVSELVSTLADRLNAARRRDNSEATDARLVQPASIGQGQKLTYTFDDGGSRPDDLQAPQPVVRNGHPDAPEADDEGQLW